MPSASRRFWLWRDVRTRVFAKRLQVGVLDRRRLYLRSSSQDENPNCTQWHRGFRPCNTEGGWRGKGTKFSGTPHPAPRSTRLQRRIALTPELEISRSASDLRLYEQLLAVSRRVLQWRHSLSAGSNSLKGYGAGDAARLALRTALGPSHCEFHP